MLTQVTEFPRFKQKSKMDGFVWMVTFLAVVVVAIDIGLLVGIVLSILCIFINSLKAHICLLGNIPDTDIYLDVERFEKAVEIPRKKIFHYSGGINFATKASFRNRLCNKLGINLLKELKHVDGQYTKEKSKKFTSDLNFEHLIVDFSALSFIDPSSVNMLECLIKDFIKLNVKFSIAGCSTKIYEVLTESGFSFMNLLYPTIQDAILSN